MSNHPGNYVENQFNNQPLPSTKYEYAQPRSFVVGNGHTKIDNPFGVDCEVALTHFITTDGGAIFDLCFDIDAPNPSNIQTGAQGMLGFHFSGPFQSGIDIPVLYVPVKDFVAVNIQGLTTGNVLYGLSFRRHAVMYLPDEPQRKYFSDPSM